MRFIAVLLAAALCAPSAAHAQKPPPLGDDAMPAPPSGKPPPLGAPQPGPAFRPRAAPGEFPALRPGEGRPYASGSGFMAASGRALTNNHVAGECGRVEARNAAGDHAPARVLATDARRDLALLGLPEGFSPPLTFRESPEISRGDTVVTYGFPLTGLLSSGPTLTTGSISALSGLRDTPLHFTISAPVQPGNSGGPLLDGQGHVVGVVVAKLNAARVAKITGGDIPQNVNFAIKGDEALAFLREHDVAPSMAASDGADLSAAAIGRIADPSTLFLLCYR